MTGPTPDHVDRPLDARRPMAVVAEFGSYAEAQRFVDRLSDRGFAVESVRIVGTGIRTVEQVTGRLTKGKAALLGAGTGAWFGLLLGLLLGLFTVGFGWFAVVLWALLLGALWGAVFGFVGHWATRGRRDFSSVQGLEAERYEIQVEADVADEANRVAAAS